MLYYPLADALIQCIGRLPLVTLRFPFRYHLEREGISYKQQIKSCSNHHVGQTIFSRALCLCTISFTAQHAAFQVQFPPRSLAPTLARDDNRVGLVRLASSTC
jgi:hypothetical protein